MKNKLPNYIPIYNDLYEKIVSNYYEKGSTLPSENVLSQEYNVSRNTVREALTILKEDGLIQKQQGRGSIVSARSDLSEAAIKKIFNPILNGSLQSIEHVEMDYNFSPPTKVAMDRLEIDAHDIVLASNNHYISEGEKIAHTFVQIPTKMFKDYPVDLNDDDAILSFMNDQMYEHAKYSETKLKVVPAFERVEEHLDVKAGEFVLYMESTLWNEHQQGIARIKYYLNPNKFELNFVIQ